MTIEFEDRTDPNLECYGKCGPTREAVTGICPYCIAQFSSMKLEAIREAVEHRQTGEEGRAIGKIIEILGEI